MPAVVTTNPATGEPLATYAAHDAAGVEAVLSEVAAAAEVWRGTSLTGRLDLLRSVGALLADRREEYAALITAEMGKPLREARAEVDKCAWNCRVVADLAASDYADHIARNMERLTAALREPLAAPENGA